MRSSKHDVESSREPQTTRKRSSARSSPSAHEVPQKQSSSATGRERKNVSKILVGNCYTNQIYDHKKRIKCHIWRVIQLILCGACFIYSVIAINKGFVRTEVPSSYLAIFLITSTALFAVVLIDIIALLYGRPYFWNSWTMIATCGLLFFILCAGLVISTEHSSQGFYVFGAVLFVITALVFLLDLLYLLKFLLYVPIYSECETILDSTDEATQFPSHLRLPPSDSFIKEPPPPPPPVVMAQIIEEEETVHTPEKELSPQPSVHEPPPPVVWREPSVVVVPPPKDVCVCDESTSTSEETLAARAKSRSGQVEPKQDKSTNFPVKSTLAARSRQQRTKSAPSTPEQKKTLQQKQQQRPSSTNNSSYYRTLEYSHQNQRYQPIQQYHQQFCWRCGQMHYSRHDHHCGGTYTTSQRNNIFNKASTIFNNNQSAQSTYRFQLFVPPTQQLAICDVPCCPTASAGVQTQKRSTTPRKRSKDPSLEDYCKKVDKAAGHPTSCQCCYCKSPTKPERTVDPSDSDTSSHDKGDEEYDRHRSEQLQLSAIVESDDSEEGCACTPAESSPQALYVHSEVSFYKTSSTSSKNKPMDASKQKKRQ